MDQRVVAWYIYLVITYFTKSLSDTFNTARRLVR